MGDRKKVLHVVNWIGDRGSEKTVLGIAKTMPDYDHVFMAKFIFSQEALDNFMSNGTVIIEESMNGGVFNYPMVNNELIKEHGIDLMVVYLPGDGLPPYIESVDCPKILYVLCTKLCNFDKSHFKEVVVLSEYAATLNPHLSPVAIYPTVDYIEPNLDRESVIKKYFPDADPDNSMLVSRIGSIETVKHVEDFLRIAKFFEHVDNMLFLVAGIGDQNYVNGLFNHYKGKNIVYAGRVTEQEKSNINNASYVCLYPTEFESFGYSIAEPMAHGVPVITYSETASPETVGDGGISVPFNDLNRLVYELANIVTRPVLRAALSKKAKDRWQSNFSSGIHADAVRKIYEKVING